MSDYQLTPTVALAPDETVQASFTADRMTYWRDMAWMAAVAMLAGISPCAAGMS
jgi:hypothetical protein